MSTPNEGSLELDLLAASLRADLGELGSFVENIADKLEATVPALVAVQRGRQGMFGPKRVRRIAVDAGGERLELIHDGGAVQARRATLSGGIVLKSETLDVEQWTETLSEALAREAGRNERTRQALERLLLG
jgi:hypothetical protein